MTDKTDSKERDSIITSSDILLHDAKTALMYEELRAAIDDGHESMTHADALAEIAAIRAENVELRAQLEAIGAGGVSGPLMGKPQEMPDLSALTERGAKAWAGVDAQGLRDGAASAGSEPVAGMNEYGVRGYLAATLKCWHRLTGDEAAELVAMTQRLAGLYLHPSPPEGMVGGWMPIETAPKDGTPFLGWVFAERYGETDEGQQYAHDESQIDHCWWRADDHGGYFDNACGQLADRQAITHWMKLPEPPNGNN